MTQGLQKHYNVFIVLWIEIELWILIHSFLETMSGLLQGMEDISKEWAFHRQSMKWTMIHSEVFWTKRWEENRSVTLAGAMHIVLVTAYIVEVQVKCFSDVCDCQYLPEYWKHKSYIKNTKKLIVNSRLIWVGVFLRPFLPPVGLFCCISDCALGRGIGKVKGDEILLSEMCKCYNPWVVLRE